MRESTTGRTCGKRGGEEEMYNRRMVYRYVVRSASFTPDETISQLIRLRATPQNVASFLPRREGREKEHTRERRRCFGTFL